MGSFPSTSKNWIRKSAKIFFILSLEERNYQVTMARTKQTDRKSDQKSGWQPYSQEKDENSVKSIRPGLCPNQSSRPEWAPNDFLPRFQEKITWNRITSVLTTQLNLSPTAEATHSVEISKNFPHFVNFPSNYFWNFVQTTLKEWLFSRVWDEFSGMFVNNEMMRYT